MEKVKTITILEGFDYAKLSQIMATTLSCVHNGNIDPDNLHKRLNESRITGCMVCNTGNYIGISSDHISIEIEIIESSNISI